MSEDTLNAIKNFLNSNTMNSNDVDSMFVNQIKRGKHAKKVIDAHRTNQDYYRLNDIHKELFDHYEQVDWYERDSSFDLDPYIERM